VKRAILLGVLVLLTVAVVYGYTETRRERMFREFVDQGETALAGENPSGAVEAFSVAIALRPETMLGYLKRGEAYQRQGDLDAALKDLLHAARLDPSSPRALELLGDVNAEKRRYDRASEHYRAYIALDDRSPRVLYKLALAEHSASQPLAAIDVLNRALALSARFAEAHYLLALCYRDLNRPQEARRSLERAIEIAPTLLHARE
jgi:tetratricopeptide (TPR) repeat protein